MKILRAGDAALLVEFADLNEVLAKFRALDAERFDGVVDLVPAARTLLVCFDRSVTGAESVRRWIVDTPAVSVDATTGNEVVIEVHYDGPDLEEVGALTGLGGEGVVSAHTGRLWTVAFGGFAPGFAYLTAGDGPGSAGLQVPRRSTPRTAVPAGAVGLAGEFSGIYPRRSPGGWQLIGTTTEKLWQPDRDPPALLRAGDQVRFVPR